MTVVQAGPCVVTQVRTADKDGYSAVQLAFGAIDPRKVNKPKAGHFAKADVAPRRHLVELRTTDASEYALGQEVTVETFAAGQPIDVTGKTKGKGFAGVDEAARLPRSAAPATVSSASTARPARSAPAPPRVASSRACGWPAGWVACATPCRT